LWVDTLPLLRQSALDIERVPYCTSFKPTNKRTAIDSGVCRSNGRWSHCCILIGCCLVFQCEMSRLISYNKNKHWNSKWISNTKGRHFFQVKSHITPQLSINCFRQYHIFLDDLFSFKYKTWSKSTINMVISEYCGINLIHGEVGGRVSL
jgi:hypothetical protein